MAVSVLSINNVIVYILYDIYIIYSQYIITLYSIMFDQVFNIYITIYNDNRYPIEF